MPATTARRAFGPISALVVFHSAFAVAAPANTVIYAAPASWVASPPAPTTAPTQVEAPLRFIYSDEQVRLGPAGEETYSAFRVRLLKPEALPIGNISIEWSPSSGSATVHFLRIFRDGTVIDVLKDQKFAVIQREGGLEKSMLDGQLTATLQVPGLRVGDELEFASTVVQRDPTVGDHGFGITQLPIQGLPGAFRFRLLWPHGRPLALRATRDLPQAVPRDTDGQVSAVYELHDPGGVIVNDGAPVRYNIRRLIEFSDFATWSDVSQRFAGLFNAAAKLAPGSLVRAEAAKIAAASTNPVERTQAALQLVEDQTRYVYVGLDGGNYRPAAADETWQRRFGDCKGKTVLLLALLRELGIEAEPVLVNLAGGDGSDARLPSPSIFNHVVVRARIGATAYWLDGTRLGDRYLDQLPAPAFRWALPLRARGADLEAVPPKAFDRPQFIGVVDIDASAGIERPATVAVTNVIRQDEAFATDRQLLALSPEDADRAVRSYWRRQMAWADPDSVTWHYDERTATMVVSMHGKGKLDWEGDDIDGHRYDLPGGGFYPPDLRRRPKEQDASDPWATEFPRFKCYATTIHLPPADGRWRWAFDAEPMNRTLGATTYWRASGMNGNVARLVMSSRTDRPEISADEAKAVNDAIPAFNNKLSRVYQLPARGNRHAVVAHDSLPFSDKADWTGAVPMCSGLAPSEMNWRLPGVGVLALNCS